MKLEKVAFSFAQNREMHISITRLCYPENHLRTLHINLVTGPGSATSFD